MYAPPAVPFEREVVLILSAVGWEEGGGSLVDVPGVRVTFPQPARRKAAYMKRRDFDLCKTAAPCVSHEPKGGDNCRERPIGVREVSAVQG